MIAYLEGKFTYKSPALVHVEVQGVGYEVQISLHTYSAIQFLDAGKLYTHLQIREDAHVLYGFSGIDEKELFLSLINVNGIGAATARMMLSSLPPDEIRQAIASGNIRLLESIKGIGKKTAERLLLELREKITKTQPVKTLDGVQGNRNEEEALLALTTLGIGRAMAEKAVQKAISLNNSANVEELIKLALKNI
jgi:Holliday junction DNA helicase RuvA